MQIKGESDIQTQLQPLLEQLRTLVDDHREDPEALLFFLRTLEELHRDVQDGAFRNSLPEDRQQLFGFLQTLERSGGWPYIPRLQLKTFIALLDQGPADIAA